MPDKMVPRPVALAMERLRELQDCYVRLRATNGASDAFADSLVTVFSPRDAEELGQFMAGSSDEYYGLVAENSGKRFGAFLMDQLEALYQELARMI